MWSGSGYNSFKTRSTGTAGEKKLAGGGEGESVKKEELRVFENRSVMGTL